MNEYLRKYETEMQLKNYCQNTITCYISMTKLFLQHFGIDPGSITEDQIKEYLKKSSSTALLKQRIGAIKLFYQKVVKQPLKFEYIEYPRREVKYPDILSKNEIKRLFAACTYLKHKAILQLFYSAGLRENEVVTLKITDIDSENGVIHIRQAKGKKDRNVPLSEKTLAILRQYYKEFRPKEYLFNGQFSKQYSVRSIQQFIKKYARIAEIKKSVHPHLIRHCFATHLVEAGTDIAIIQNMLGHKSQRTTMIYAHISKLFISRVVTPDMVL